MEQIDLETMRIKTSSVKKTEDRRTLPRHKNGEKFIAGPIPWNWWARAACLPGKSLHVASAIWFLASVKKSATFQLQGAVLRGLGVSRKSVYHALKALETAGLIVCVRGSGKRSSITVLDVSEKINGNGNEGSMTGENK